MTSEQKTELYETMPIPKAVATLAVPTVLSSFVMVSYNLADIYFVGMINNPVESVAATLAVPVLPAFNAIINFLGVNAETAVSTSDYMLWTVVFGAVPSILNVILANMIRSGGESLHAGVGTISGCFLNIILDPFFIMPRGLNMGAAGAGYATFVSNCAACPLFLRLPYRQTRENLRQHQPEKLRLPPCHRQVYSSVGIPVAVQNLQI